MNACDSERAVATENKRLREVLAEVSSYLNELEEFVSFDALEDCRSADEEETLDDWSGRVWDMLKEVGACQ